MDDNPTLTWGYKATMRAEMLVHQASVLRFAAEATRALDPIRPACLRWTDDVYRAVTAETAHLVLTGALTREQAAARAMDRYAALGVTGFTDRSGTRYRWSPTPRWPPAPRWRTPTWAAPWTGSPTRAGTRWRSPTPPEECPLCRPWEGKILSLSGDGQHPPITGATAGLFHPNCTHTVTAYIPGLTRLRTPDPNPAGYADRQRQRKLERRVRESQRRVNAAEQMRHPTVLAYNRRLLAHRRDDLRTFIQAAGRKPSVSARRVLERH